MGDPRYNVWNEVLIPFFSDQRVLDQLWCTNRTMQTIMISNIKNIRCWCRPMDAIIKPRGIYPSYITQLVKLQSITVAVEPRLRNTWKTFVRDESTFNELYPNSLPLTLRYFDTSIDSFTWKDPNNTYDKMRAALPPTERGDPAHLNRIIRESIRQVENNMRDAIFQWLDRFDNIVLGPKLKGYLSNEREDGATVASYLTDNFNGNITYLRYQYITKISLWRVGEILYGLAMSGNAELLRAFLNGITALSDVEPYTMKLTDIKITELPHTSLEYLSLNTQGIIGSHGIQWTALRRLFPNLNEISAKSIKISVPDGIVSYIFEADAHNNLVRSNNPSITLSNLPNSVLIVQCPWNRLPSEIVQLPKMLTELHIHSMSVNHDAAGLSKFNQLVKALPESMKILDLRFVEPGRRSAKEFAIDYWISGNVALLPRGLHIMNWLPPQYVIHWGGRIKSQDIDNIINTLPPGLTSMSMPRNLLPYNVSLLPKSLTTISLAMFKGCGDLINVNVSLFTHLRIMTIEVVLPDVSLFPSINLPDTLEKFTIVVDSSINPGWKVPLTSIVWPASMELVKIRGIYGRDSDVMISQWHLPKQLAKLVVKYVTITELPYVWPTDLRKFKCVTTAADNKFGPILPVVWPDIERKIYYLPNSTTCLMCASNQSLGPGEFRDIVVHQDPHTHRPVLKQLK